MPLREITSPCLSCVCLKRHFQERIFKETQHTARPHIMATYKHKHILSYPLSIKSLEAKTRIERITDKPSKPPSNAAWSSNLPEKRAGRLNGNMMESNTSKVKTVLKCQTWLSPFAKTASPEWADTGGCWLESGQGRICLVAHLNLGIENTSLI